jgi:hypothetical protein
LGPGALFAEWLDTPGDPLLTVGAAGM